MFCLALLLFLTSSVQGFEVSKVALPAHLTKFNMTTARCFEPDNVVDPLEKWFIASSKDIKNSYCYDTDGVAHRYNTQVSSCCNCITWLCHYSSARGTVYPFSSRYFMYWRLYTVSSSCCQDCEGVIYPSEETISTESLGDECDTEVKSVCKHNDDWSRYKGVIAQVYTSKSCCIEMGELHPLGTTLLDASHCSSKTCQPGVPPVWATAPAFPGMCDCCVFNETLVPDGGVVEVEPGLNATCCEGKIVVNYDIEIPKNCSDADAVHGSIGISIDSTGSMGGNHGGDGCVPLSRSIVDEIVSLSYIIPKWILTTFKDWTDGVPPGDNLVLEVVTNDPEIFKTAVSNITFGGGGDSPERAMQGLLLTLQTMPQHGVVLVFLDTTTKDQDLLDDVVALRDEKEIKIFVVYAPRMNSGSVGDASWTVLNTVSEGRIYDMSEFNRTLFIEEVTQVVGSDCEGSSLLAEMASARPPAAMAASMAAAAAAAESSKE